MRKPDPFKGQVLDGLDEGLDTTEGRWLVSCDRHGILSPNFRTRREALSWDYTPEWCEACGEEWERLVKDKTSEPLETCSICTTLVPDRLLIDTDEGRLCKPCFEELT